VCVKALVVPISRASANLHDPPTPLKVIGLPIVVAFVVMTRVVADVEANVHVLAVLTVIVEESVRSP